MPFAVRTHVRVASESRARAGFQLPRQSPWPDGQTTDTNVEVRFEIREQTWLADVKVPHDPERPLLVVRVPRGSVGDMRRR